MALQPWTGRTGGQIDADSPVDIVLWGGVDDDFTHLRQVLYGDGAGGFRTPIDGHNHVAANSAPLGTDTVDTAQIVASAVDTAEIATNAVTNNEIDSLTITSGNIANQTISEAKMNLLTRSEIQIGDWDMDATAQVNVAHGLTLSNIRTVQIIIKNDADTARYPIEYAATGSADGSWYADGTNINIARRGGGSFDSTTFDATSYNRGFIIITSAPV